MRGFGESVSYTESENKEKTKYRWQTYEKKDFKCCDRYDLHHVV